MVHCELLSFSKLNLPLPDFTAKAAAYHVLLLLVLFVVLQVYLIP